MYIQENRGLLESNSFPHHPSLSVSKQTSLSLSFFNEKRCGKYCVIFFVVVVCSLGFCFKKKKIKRNRGVKRASSLIFAVESLLDENVKKKNKKIIIVKQ